MIYVILFFLSSFIVNIPHMLIHKQYLKFSSCDYCNKKIPFYRNIPIISGLFKTRCCKERILKYSFHEGFMFLISCFFISQPRLLCICCILYILAIYDSLTLEIHYPIFILLIILLFLWFPIYSIHWIVIVLFIFSMFNHLGFADIIFIFFTSMFIKSLTLYILIASSIGILHIILSKQQQIPFLPALCITFFILLIF